MQKKLDVQVDRFELNKVHEQKAQIGKAKAKSKKAISSQRHKELKEASHLT